MIKIKYIGLLILVLWVIVILSIGQWFETIPIIAQEKEEYQGINLPGNTEGASLLNVYKEKETSFYSVDSFSRFYQFSPAFVGGTVRLLTVEDVLALLKEYRSYCDTVTTETVRFYHAVYDNSTGKVIYDSSRVKQKGTFMSLEGLTDWLENVKLK